MRNTTKVYHRQSHTSSKSFWWGLAGKSTRIIGCMFALVPEPINHREFEYQEVLSRTWSRRDSAYVKIIVIGGKNFEREDANKSFESFLIPNPQWIGWMEPEGGNFFIHVFKMVPIWFISQKCRSRRVWNIHCSFIFTNPHRNPRWQNSSKA